LQSFPEHLDDWAEQARRTLREHLPDYMLPTHLLPLDAWPLTLNGKLDRLALPAPDPLALQGAFVAPSSPTERRLARLWGRLFAIDPDAIGVHSNFFALGGHSLLLVRLHTQITALWGAGLSLREVFDADDLGAL